jgi:signal transduction histidine kinase
MTEENGQLLARLAERIDAIADGRPAPPGPDKGHLPAQLGALVDSIDRLAENFDQLRRISIALANGKIDTDVPPKQHLLDPLKSLQASLKHLTWQTQEVAAGNLDQHVDFLGDFSVAFNKMVAALKDKRKAEHDAMQASKLASIGQLAAGIAHEINTPTQYVGDNLSYIANALPDMLKALQGGPALSERDIAIFAEDLPAAVAEARQGVARIAKIVGSMKEFSHPGTTEMSNTDINKALESTLTVSQNEWKMVAEIETRLAPDLPAVLCFASEVNQVFLNLILNAAQAIQGSGKKLPGRILIESFEDQGAVVVRFTDNGPGIPEDLRERIFDPFFTTKPVGQGTGQGLAISRDVIEAKHGGRIEVGGNVGEGTVFTVRLPHTVCELKSVTPA